MPVSLKIIYNFQLYLRFNSQLKILFGYVYYAHLVVFDLVFTTNRTYILSLSEWQQAGVTLVHTDKWCQMKDLALCSPAYG